MKYSKETPHTCCMWGGKLMMRNDGGNIINVQYKPNHKCHYESLLYKHPNKNKNDTLDQKSF
jgi:hypothetical protein